MFESLMYKFSTTSLDTTVMEKSLDGVPVMWDAHLDWTVLVSDEILPRSVNVPTVRPRANRKSHLFSHEEPREVRIKRNVHQKFSPRKEKSGPNECHLRRICVIFVGSSLHFDAGKPIFCLSQLAFAESRSGCEGWLLSEVDCDKNL